MEENKGLMTQRIIIILLLLIVIATICAGVYMLNDSSNTVNNIATSENVVDKANKNEVNKVNENIVEENKIENEEVIEEENTEVKFDLAEINVIKDIENAADEKLEIIAKNTLTEYLKIEPFEKSSIGPMPNLLVRLGLETSENIEKLLNNVEVANKNDYITSNVSYADFKNTLLKVVSEDYFIKYYSQYKDVDGYVAFCNCAGAGINYSIIDTELKEKIDNKYVFDVTIRDEEIYNIYLNGEPYKEEDYLFKEEVEFVYIEDRLVIEKNNEQIILEGYFPMPESDVAYDFYKDGTVEYSSNMYVTKGSYIMSGEDEITITWKEETRWDLDTSEETTNEISGTEKLMVVSNNKVIFINESGEINEFVKNIRDN